jgi:hypothetical protein
MTTSRLAIREITGVKNDRNAKPSFFLAIFPNCAAPIVRDHPAGRE